MKSSTTTTGQPSLTIAGSGKYSLKVAMLLHDSGYNVNLGKMTEFFPDSLPDLRTIKNSDIVIYIGDGLDCYSIENFKYFIADCCIYPEKIFLYVMRNEDMTAVGKMLQSWQQEALKEIKYLITIRTDNPVDICNFVELILPVNRVLLVENSRNKMEI